MKTIIIRPSIESEVRLQELEKSFETMSLIDKTVVEDRVIYVFDNKSEKPEL